MVPRNTTSTNWVFCNRRRLFVFSSPTTRALLGVIIDIYIPGTTHRAEWTLWGLFWAYILYSSVIVTHYKCSYSSTNIFVCMYVCMRIFLFLQPIWPPLHYLSYIYINIYIYIYVISSRSLELFLRSYCHFFVVGVPSDLYGEGALVPGTWLAFDFTFFTLIDRLRFAFFC